MRGIRKRFGAVTALDGVDLEILEPRAKEGRVVRLRGEIFKIGRAQTADVVLEDMR